VIETEQQAKEREKRDQDQANKAKNPKDAA
jgi:hypothetical protein